MKRLWYSKNPPGQEADGECTLRIKQCKRESTKKEKGFNAIEG